MLKRTVLAVSTLLLLPALALPATAGGEGEKDDANPPVRMIKVRLEGRDLTAPGFAGTLTWDRLYDWIPTENGPELRPCLAAGWPEYSEDGLSCTIALRPEARFRAVQVIAQEGGRAMTAQDVIMAIKFAAIRDDGHCFRQVIRSLGDDLAKALQSPKDRDRLRLTAEATTSGLKTLEDGRLQVALSHPTRDLPLLLASPLAIIRPNEIYCKDMGYGRSKDERYLGAGGPYRCTVLTSSIVWDVDPDYWDQSVDVAHWRHATGPYYDPESLPERVQVGIDAGDLDFSPCMLQTFAQGAKAPPAYGTYDSESFYYVAFNMADTVWGGSGDKTRALRTAFHHAAGRDALCTPEHYGDDCRAADDLVPAMRGLARTAPEADWAEGGEKAALEALEKAGVRPFDGEGAPSIPLLLLAEEKSLPKRARELLTASLRRAGINLTIELVAQDVFLERLAKGEFQAAWYGWANDYPDPLNMLARLHSRCAADAIETQVPCRYSNPEYDKLLEQCEAVGPEPAKREERRKHVQALCAHLAKERPFVPLLVPRFALMVRPGLKVPEMPWSGGGHLRYLRWE